MIEINAKIDREMPKKCMNCWLSYASSNREWICGITYERINEDTQERGRRCPLSPVKENDK